MLKFMRLRCWIDICIIHDIKYQKKMNKMCSRLNATVNQVIEERFCSRVPKKYLINPWEITLNLWSCFPFSPSLNEVGILMRPTLPSRLISWASYGSYHLVTLCYEYVFTQQRYSWKSTSHKIQTTTINQ